jgi:hypothetical protein
MQNIALKPERDYEAATYQVNTQSAPQNAVRPNVAHETTIGQKRALRSGSTAVSADGDNS